MSFRKVMLKLTLKLFAMRNSKTEYCWLEEQNMFNTVIYWKYLANITQKYLIQKRKLQNLHEENWNLYFLIRN